MTATASSAPPIVEFVVTGQTRDFGVVGLPHRWLPGRGEAQAVQ